MLTLFHTVYIYIYINSPELKLFIYFNHVLETGELSYSLTYYFPDKTSALCIFAVD